MSNITLAKQLVAACMEKDFDTVRTLVDANYTLKDPMMTLQGAEELITMIEACPFECTMQNAQYLDAGDRVILTADNVVSGPEKFTWRMCDIMTFKNGKVVAEEMFYDTAQFPKSVLEAGATSVGDAKKKTKAA